jgi:hypothetical protein
VKNEWRSLTRNKVNLGAATESRQRCAGKIFNPGSPPAAAQTLVMTI